MNPLHAGLMCTLLLIGTIAGLFSCMSAVRCHRRFAFAICLTIASLDFAALAILLSRLPESAALSPAPWTAAALLLWAFSLSALFLLRRKNRRQLSPVSIKESCDHLPSALCFAWENGQPCLKNLKMDELSHLLTGEALLNANVFWKAIESQPIITLENGQTWSFERARMEMAGKNVYQITGTNITEEARLQREEEILRAKTRVHDQIGRALLQTRQFLSGAQDDAESVRAAWRQNVRLLLGKYADEQPVDTFDQLARAARAIGVTIERRGVFPAEDTESAQLVEIAAHECLTNLVRHAGGTRLEIIGGKTASGWRVRYLNDGSTPAGPIVEGSGLTALRARVEAAGGAMEIAYAPRFELTLTFFEGRQ